MTESPQTLRDRGKASGPFPARSIIGFRLSCPRIWSAPRKSFDRAQCRIWADRSASCHRRRSAASLRDGRLESTREGSLYRTKGRSRAERGHSWRFHKIPSANQGPWQVSHHEAVTLSTNAANDRRISDGSSCLQIKTTRVFRSPVGHRVRCVGAWTNCCTAWTATGAGSPSIESSPFTRKIASPWRCSSIDNQSPKAVQFIGRSNISVKARMSSPCRLGSWR